MTCQFCSTDHAVAVPCVHTNGTSAEELLYQLDRAVNALQGAVEALYAAAPNNRDYYPTKSEAFAQAQHTERAKKLSDVRAELREMRDHVQEVINLKNERKATAK